MGEISVVCNLTLDGVMQAPGLPDEDLRGDFPYGGWAAPYSQDAMGRVLGQRAGRSGGMLLGRRTYEQFAAFWPKQPDNPLTLGTGQRLFEHYQALELTDSITTTTGVVIGTYRPAQTAMAASRNADS
ncbi:hypothetical protein AB0F43_36015 [Kribbella sp. NPDC023972]|uniref:hypothetical protein n=1 Tax=Kribbella sp. NPDC023972 TaxID=3154795 RepID=UPI0033E972DB